MHSIQACIFDVRISDTTFHQMDYEEDLFRGNEFAYHVANLTPPPWSDRSCHVYMYGRCTDGTSICVHVGDFFPYMFFPYHPDIVGTVCAALAEDVIEDGKRRKGIQVDAQWMHAHATRLDAAHFYGWEPNDKNPNLAKTRPYIKIHFPTVAAFRKAGRMRVGFPAEHAVDPVTQFLDVTGTKASGWVQIDTFDYRDKDAIFTHCQHEVDATLQSIVPLDRLDIPRAIVLSVDIECVSDKLEFPDHQNDKDDIVFIGVVVWGYGDPLDQMQKFVFCTGDCDPMEGIVLHKSPTERDMLQAFRDFLVCDIDPDIVIGYNTYGFDNRYLWKRAEKLGVSTFKYLSRNVHEKCRGEEREMSSNQTGQNEYFLIDTLGRIHVDVYPWMKTNRKLASYKLDDVSELYLSEKKVELDPQQHYKELLRMCRDNNGAEKAKVGIYCVQDCVLPLRLALELEVFEGYVSMSRITSTFIQKLATGGQQQKVWNQLVLFAHRDKPFTVLNDPPVEMKKSDDDDDDDKYEGATVIDPKRGYYSNPVTTLDFASLYPSIMRTHNLCPSKLILDQKYVAAADRLGISYETHAIADAMTYQFIRTGTDEEGRKTHEGIVPKVLTHLLTERKRVKNLMKNETDKKKLSILNAEQLSLKVSANSTYGFFGAARAGKYPCLPIAVCTTFLGRNLIHETKELSERTYDCEVVYGDTDSVFVHFRDNPTLAEAFERGDRLAELATNEFPGVIELENEKTYKPLLLMAKKRYIGLMFEETKNGIEQTKLDAKGVEIVRRDNAPWAKMVYTDVMKTIMYDNDTEKAVERLHQHMKDLVNGEYEFDDFILSKSLKKEYKSNDLPHVKVVEKMRSRAPGSEPRVGDRVQFIFVETPRATKAWQKAEDPVYAKREGVKIDRLHYVNSQIIKPIKALLECFVDDPEKLFQTYIHQLENQQSGQRTLDMFGLSCETFKPARPIVNSGTMPNRAASSTPADQRQNVLQDGGEEEERKEQEEYKHALGNASGVEGKPVSSVHQEGDPSDGRPNTRESDRGMVPTEKKQKTSFMSFIDVGDSPASDAAASDRRKKVDDMSSFLAPHSSKRKPTAVLNCKPAKQANTKG